MEQLATAALYIDLDNVLTNLKQNYGHETEYDFVNGINRWLTYLCGVRHIDVSDNRAGENAAYVRRIFRRKVVYANPVCFGMYRKHFINNGFKFVDCPPITAQGKTSTDMFLAVDAVRDSFMFPHYEDFVVISNDADFSPVLVHLNEMGKNTVLVTLGSVSSVLTSVATCNVTGGDFVKSFSVIRPSRQAMEATAVAVKENPEQENEESQPEGATQTPEKQPVESKQPPVLSMATAVCNNSPRTQPVAMTREEVLKSLDLPILSPEAYDAFFKAVGDYVSKKKAPSYYSRAIMHRFLYKYDGMDKKAINKLLYAIDYDSVEELGVTETLRRYCHSLGISGLYVPGACHEASPADNLMNMFTKQS